MDGEKNVLYSPNIERAFHSFFYFDKRTGYTIHLYPTSEQSKKISQKFLKKFLAGKTGRSNEGLSPYASIIFYGKEILMYFTSDHLDLNKLFSKLERIAKSNPQPKNIRDIDQEVVAMLTNRITGLSIAAPERENPMMPYQSSGGYGYCWFRDCMKELEILPQLFRKLLKTFCEKNYEELPHRVWAFDGSIAPGWANGYLVNQPWNYQSDQLASFVLELSKYVLKNKNIEECGVDLLIKFSRKLLERSYKDGMPTISQNCWEDHNGIFSHTAGVYLQAFLNASKALEKIGFSKLSKQMMKKANRLSKAVKIFWYNNAFRFYLEYPREEYYRISSISELRKLNYRKGRLIKRLDSGTFELIKALIMYDKEKFADYIISHLRTSIPYEMLKSKPLSFKGLWKKTKSIEGLVRYQGDLWRHNPGKYPEKIWTVATLEGVETLLLASSAFKKDRDISKEFFDIATHLFSVFKDVVLLSEQYYDDGTPDSAIPLGWSHALRWKIRRMFKSFY